MIPSFAIAAAAVFVLVLLLLRTRGEQVEEREASTPDPQNRFGGACALPPTELVVRIFSPNDREFILLTHSPRLQRLYKEERRKVAIDWVRRISREVGRIMSNHRLRSRQSPNMDVVAETKLFCQYLELRFLCGMLLFLVHLFGPHALLDLASSAGQLFEQLGRTLPDQVPASRFLSSGNSAT
jgi:hypothetical protein